MLRNVSMALVASVLFGYLLELNIYQALVLYLCFVVTSTSMDILSVIEGIQQEVRSRNRGKNK